MKDKEFMKTVEERYNKFNQTEKNEFWDGYKTGLKNIVQADVYSLLKDVFDWEKIKREEMQMSEKEKEGGVVKSEIVQPEHNEMIVSKKKEALLVKKEMPMQEWREIVECLFKSGMFTDIRSVAQAVTKAQCGKELGFPPYYSLQNFFILPGKPPAATGQVMAALIKRSGMDYMVVKHDDSICTLRFFGVKGQVIGEASFTYKEAYNIIIGGKRLTDKTNWKNYRQDMLFWRTVARGSRRFCPDAIAGLYLKDEIEVVQTEGVTEDSDLGQFKVDPVKEEISNQKQIEPEKTRKDILGELVGKHGRARVLEVKEKCGVKGNLTEEVSDEEFKKIVDTLVTLGKVKDKVKDEKPKEGKETQKDEMTKAEKNDELNKLKDKFGVKRIKEVKEDMKLEGNLNQFPEKEFKKFVRQVKSK